MMYLSPFQIILLVLFVSLWLTTWRFNLMADIERKIQERLNPKSPPPAPPAPPALPLPRIGFASHEEYVAYRKAHGLPYNTDGWSQGA